MKLLLLSFLIMDLLLGTPPTSKTEHNVSKETRKNISEKPRKFTIHVVTHGHNLNVRERASEKSKIIGSAEYNKNYSAFTWVKGDGRGWYAILWNDKIGYVCSEFAVPLIE